jgi:hypothetical protein
LRHCVGIALVASISALRVERDWGEARLMRLAPIPPEMATNFIAEHVLGLPCSC